MDILDDEILQLWKLLHTNNVEYIMVGGFATNLHGYVRTTADIDIWIKDTLANRKNLRKVLNDLEVGDFSMIETMDFLAGWTNIRLTSGFELDIMTNLKGFEKEKFEDCFEIAPIAFIQDIPIRFLHLNHLIEEKKICARPKDLLDVIELEKIREEKK